MDTHFSWLAVLAQGLTDTRYPTMMFLLRIFAVCHVSLSGCCNANADPDAGETTLRVPRPALECLCEHGWKPWGDLKLLAVLVAAALERAQLPDGSVLAAVQESRVEWCAT